MNDNLTMYPLSQKSQRLTQITGAVIAIAWLSTAIAANVIGEDFFLKYGLRFDGEAEFPFYVTMFTYSFLHFLGLHIVSNGIFLWIAVQISKPFINWTDLIRLYSLGTVGSGLVYGLASFLVDEQIPLVGGSGAFLAIIGAVTIRIPKSEALWMTILVGILIVYSFTEGLPLGIGQLSGFLIGLVYGYAERILTQEKQAYRPSNPS